MSPTKKPSRKASVSRSLARKLAVAKKAKEKTSAGKPAVARKAAPRKVARVDKVVRGTAAVAPTAAPGKESAGPAIARGKAGAVRSMARAEDGAVPTAAEAKAGATQAAESFPQRALASPKQLLLFELLRARTSFLSAIHGLTPGSASEPIAPGKWSPREIVLHLVTRDQARLQELESALRGVPASWKRAKEQDWARINEASLAPLRHHDWDEALRLLHRTRQQLVQQIEGVPEEPSALWEGDHPFGGMLAGLPPHDRHHGDQIKRWRATRGG